MLESSFIHIQGIGYTTERLIWDLGCHTWEQFTANADTLRLSVGKKALALPVVEESARRLSEGDHEYFAGRLPTKEHWRALSRFGDSIGFLDIETTGCGAHDKITVIGLSDGFDTRVFVRGRDLHEFPEAVSRFKMLVTFFGTGFDLPMIRREFPGIRLKQLHVDLCFLLKRIGLSGGLKKIEQTMGISRRPETHGLDGMDAVRLWYAYRNGSEEALDLLISYNKEDVENMLPLLIHGVTDLHSRTGFPSCAKGFLREGVVNPTANVV